MSQVVRSWSIPAFGLLDCLQVSKQLAFLPSINRLQTGIQECVCVQCTWTLMPSEFLILNPSQILK